MPVLTATPDAHEDGARRGLLERLARGLSVISRPQEHAWECCWLSYAGPRGERWAWQMCGHQMPGGLPYGPDGRNITCGHWHHRSEVFLAG